jgi:hypothetical protein
MMTNTTILGTFQYKRDVSKANSKFFRNDFNARMQNYELSYGVKQHSQYVFQSSGKERFSEICLSAPKFF